MNRNISDLSLVQSILAAGGGEILDETDSEPCYPSVTNRHRHIVQNLYKNESNKGALPKIITADVPQFGLAKTFNSSVGLKATKKQCISQVWSSLVRLVYHTM